MLYRKAFDNYNPCERQALPGALPQLLHGIADRAREIVSHRTRDQLEYAAESLHWMLARYFIAAIDKVAKAEPIGPNKYVGTILDTDTLKCILVRVDLRNQASFPDATEAEYFALLALATIGGLVTLAIEGATDEQNIYEWQWDYSDFMLEGTATAIEAVCIAEHMIEMANAERSALSKRGRKGGRTKASRFDFLKTECLHQYRDYHQGAPSAREASRRIHEALEPHFLEIFDTPDPGSQRDRIAGWIRKYDNNLLTIPAYLSKSS